MTTTVTQASIRNRHFVSRRIHSLFGLVPIGAFLLFHLWENSLSRNGMEHYNTYVVEKIQNINYVWLLEIFVIALPILFHGIYGVMIWWRSKSNVATYPYFRNWMWWAQRISGLAVFVFLIVHVGWTRILAEFDEEVAADMFGHMESLFSNPAYLTFYVIGLVLAVFHLANGIWSAGIAWGLTSSVTSQRIMQAVSVGIFVVVTALGVHGLIGFFIA